MGWERRRKSRRERGKEGVRKKSWKGRCAGEKTLREEGVIGREIIKESGGEGERYGVTEVEQ